MNNWLISNYTTSTYMPNMKHNIYHLKNLVHSIANYPPTWNGKNAKWKHLTHCYKNTWMYECVVHINDKLHTVDINVNYSNNLTHLHGAEFMGEVTIWQNSNACWTCTASIRGRRWFGKSIIWKHAHAQTNQLTLAIFCIHWLFYNYDLVSCLSSFETNYVYSNNSLRFHYNTNKCTRLFYSKWRVRKHWIMIYF